jgi:hypothetical protein
MRSIQFTFVLTGLLVLSTSGCKSLAEVEVKCEKLCLTEPGPTIPGLTHFLPASAGWDAGFLVEDDWPIKSEAVLPVDIDAGIATVDADCIDAEIPTGALDGGQWAFAADAGVSPNLIQQMIPMAYNEVLDQLPGIAAGIDADVRLFSLKVTSPMDLGFVDEIEVTLFAGHSGDAIATSVDSAVSTEAIDAGFSVANPDGKSLCGENGLLVASYHRLATDPSGSSAELTIADPALNLFSCLSGAPASFRIQLKLAPGELPDTDTPLSVTSCMSAHAKIELP